MTSSAPGRLTVLIAGGGIGGIVTALALRQRGMRPLLFEQAEAFGEVGAGIQLSANATRVLRSLGLDAALARIAVRPEARVYYAWDTGERLFSTPLGDLAERRFGAPYYHVHRAHLLDALVAALGGEGVHLGARVTAVAQDERQVTITFADGGSASGDVLIGADGIHSTVRTQLFGADRPRYTGNVAWRGLVPAQRLSGLGLERVTGVWMGPNRSVVFYYVAAGRTFNWIGISRTADAASESWLAEGRVDDALTEYAGWHPMILEVIRATPRLLRQAIFDREPLPQWQSGRTVLLGDAAHAMMPFYAQGAAQSIEDGYVLAGCLAAAPDAPVAALARYVQLRQPRTAWMQAFARREETLYQTADREEIARRDARMRARRERFSARFPPEQEQLYGYDAEAALRGGVP